MNSYIMFTAPWCGLCKQMKAELDAKGVGYLVDYLDVQTTLSDYLEEHNVRGLPHFLINNKTVTKEEFVEALLA